MAGANYTSKRQYLSQSELAEYADITISNTSEADDQISQAEELIDAYVGFQKKAVCEEVIGRVASATATTLTLEAARHANTYQGNYFLYCEVEITAGTGIGQRRIVTASTYAGILTVATWATTPDSTSYYRIYQLGKFPRDKDVYFDGNVSPQVYVKSIPVNVRRAVAAQVEYFIAMGTNHFKTSTSTMESESIGDYSYSSGSGEGESDGDTLLAPKAMRLLRGITNRKGRMIVEG